MRVAARFERGDKTEDIARDEQVGKRRVERWRRVWRTGGTDALRSVGSPGRSKLDDAQFARLARELERGPAAHGWDDQRWTLARIGEVIHRLFGVSYTLKGVSVLMARHGWSWQVPVRRAVERDQEQVCTWVGQVWPAVKASGRPRTPG